MVKYPAAVVFLDRWDLLLCWGLHTREIVSNELLVLLVFQFAFSSYVRIFPDISSSRHLVLVLFFVF